MQDLCVTATRDHNVYASFRPSIATKDAETRSKMNSGTVNQLGAENPHFHVKMAMTVLVLELQGGKKIRMSLMSSLKVYKI